MLESIMAWDHPPIAVCSRCGAPLDIRHSDLIHGRCRQKGCGGTYEGSTLKLENWGECVRCGGAGRKGDLRCRDCQGSGYFYYFYFRR
jgi:hypothetical protein